MSEQIPELAGTKLTDKGWYKSGREAYYEMALKVLSCAKEFLYCCAKTPTLFGMHRERQSCYRELFYQFGRIKADEGLNIKYICSYPHYEKEMLTVAKVDPKLSVTDINEMLKFGRKPNVHIRFDSNGGFDSHIISDEWVALPASKTPDKSGVFKSSSAMLIQGKSVLGFKDSFEQYWDYLDGHDNTDRILRLKEKLESLLPQ
ncbi:hypothetical protein EPN87_04725 [archaeon]|nr:MAG: hypothetical protein EPN87_04725 [archaeon]